MSEKYYSGDINENALIQLGWNIFKSTKSVEGSGSVTRFFAFWFKLYPVERVISPFENYYDEHWVLYLFQNPHY